MILRTMAEATGEICSQTFNVYITIFKQKKQAGTATALK